MNPSLNEILSRYLRRYHRLRLDRFLALCAYHRHWGYYRRADQAHHSTQPSAAMLERDFYSAPMISQIFGEVLAAWAGALFLGLRSTRRAERVFLVELGGGGGQLLSDLWRASASVPGWRPAMSLGVVESSEALRARQHALWRTSSMPTPLYFRDIEHLVSHRFESPVIIIANEFFDCFPIRQFVWRQNQFLERDVQAEDSSANPSEKLPERQSERLSKKHPKNLSAPSQEKLYAWTLGERALSGAESQEVKLYSERFGDRKRSSGAPVGSESLGSESLGSEPLGGEPLDGALLSGKKLGRAPLVDGTIVERSEATLRAASQLGALLRRVGGGALIVDYGVEQGVLGDSLQAVRAHRYVKLWEALEGADTSSYVRFEPLIEAFCNPHCAPLAAAPWAPSGAWQSKPNWGELRCRLSLQSRFLQDWGASLRFERLYRRELSFEQLRRLRRGYEALMAPQKMGSVFKALEIFPDSISF